MSGTGPGPDERGLADALRRLRLAAGLTGDRLAARCGMSQSRLSRIETGRTTPSVADVERLLAALDVPGGTRREVLGLARAVAVRQGAGGGGRQDAAAAMDDRVRLVRAFAPTSVPSVLGTSAAAIHPARGSGPGPAGVDRDAADRDPLLDGRRQFRVLLAEAALPAYPATDPASSAQLGRLLEVSRRPNVEIGVLPRDAGLPRVPQEAFLVLDDRAVVTGTGDGESILRTPSEIARHVAVFTLLAAVACWGEQARGILVDRARR